MISGVKITDACVGSGPIAGRGNTVVIHYRGSLSRGDEFQNTYDEGRPVTISIGSRQVIAGLEYGLEGMRVGGKRHIKVSPHLAYRDKGVPGVIPPDAVLIFEVELLEVLD